MVRNVLRVRQPTPTTRPSGTIHQPILKYGIADCASCSTATCAGSPIMASNRSTSRRWRED
jgi:hypothetical protein